ncbi:MAG: D-Ala-D-Ala carboxypeptidase family metallohydrolase [Oculatellaceae cyanobacterium Prado106]|nr:D-Ala-D-Ala carboxypeptidase family metallohydrolase [Oculatellaceae cyanobacterium Prado106]
MVNKVLKITDDTIFKLRPLQSLELSPEEQFSVLEGRQFAIESYAYADASGDFEGHIRVALQNQADWVRGRNTWYVYKRHAQVLFDGRVVYPQEDQVAVLILKVVRATIFKRRPIPSTQLPEAQKQEIPNGSIFALDSYAFANAQGDFDNHIRFALKNSEDYIYGLNTWYVYNRHAQVLYDGKVVYPRFPSQRFTGTPFKLPGNRSTFYTDQPIIPGGSFTWGEATKEAQRIPTDINEVTNILALAKQLQRARNQIGKPFNITSWYRPEPFNSQAGGVPNSQHLSGRAVDFWVEGYLGRQLAFELFPWWPGGVGTYSGSRSDVVQLDIGPKRTWGF